MPSPRDQAQSTLEALRAPAEVIERLVEEAVERDNEIEALKAKLAETENALSRANAEAGRLAAELARTGPVPPYDEVWLAKRGASITWRIPLTGARAGKPEATLTGARINPVVGASAVEVLDQVRDRAPVRRRASK